jgi:hypothetical protein
MLHREKKFLASCDAIIRWVWDVQVLYIEDQVCLGATQPPESCGGPEVYRLVLKGDATAAQCWSRSRDSDVDRVKSSHSGSYLDVAEYGADEYRRSLDPS